MLPSFSQSLRLALVLALSVGYVAWHGHVHPAHAADDDDDSGDDSDKPSEDEEGGEEDKDQPPVTAGGLYTLKTYPVSEILRPLTITKGILQARLGVGTDVSDKGAFKSAGLSLEGQYGMADNFMVIGGVTSAYNFKQFAIYAGIEGSLYYDLVDFRLAANLHRSATANTAEVMGPNGMTQVLPDGTYTAGSAKLSVDLGFPFRYAIKPEIAIVALQTLMTIDFNEVDGNKTTPDLNPSVGVATNPIPALSVVAFAQLQIPDFDTSPGLFKVPLTARVEFSPNRQFDIGLEFTLLNVKPKEPQKPFDNRFVSLFAQFRMGK